MPAANGWQVLDELEQLEGHPPVLLITAFGDASVHRRALDSGAWEIAFIPPGSAAAA